jgi:hypothetical protein
VCRAASFVFGGQDTMAAPSLSFDPSQVIVAFLGTPLHGFIDGVFVKVSRNEEAFKLQVGADGEAARVRNRNRSGQVTITLQQTSVSNDVLSAAAALDELGSGGVGALLIKDLNGSTLVSALSAWVRKVPDAELGKELGQREWVLETGTLAMFIGGNPL